MGFSSFTRQLGIEAVQFNTPAIDGAEGYWTYETLMSLGRACQESGLVLQAIENVPGQFMTDIKFGGPAREHQLDNYCRTVENMGRAGIGILGFNFATTGVWRTEREALGRGGTRVSAFDAAMLESGNEEVGPQGVVAGSGGVMITEEELWRNFEIFLHRVLPVAEAAGVRLALHPDDPPLPAIGPTARLFYSVENMRRAYETAEGSEAFGFDLCLGTVSEMSDGAETVRGAMRDLRPAGGDCLRTLSAGSRDRTEVSRVFPRGGQLFAEGNDGSAGLVGVRWLFASMTTFRRCWAIRSGVIAHMRMRSVTCMGWFAT